MNKLPQVQDCTGRAVLYVALRGLREARAGLKTKRKEHEGQGQASAGLQLCCHPEVTWEPRREMSVVLIIPIKGLFPKIACGLR